MPTDQMPPCRIEWPQKALVVLGASEEQIPLYREAQRRGIPTIGVDMRPDAPAFRLADAALKVSTRDADAIASALGDTRPAGIVCGASDAALSSWHTLGRRYGFPYVYPKSALAAGDKAAFHEIAASCGVAGYGWVASDNPDEIVAKAAAELRFPLAVKPVDGSGSKGVVRVTRPDDLSAAVAHAHSFSASQAVIAEEFCQGRPLVIDIFMQGGRSKLTCIHDVEFSATSFAIKRLRSPAQLPLAVRDRLEATAERLCLALGVTDGPADFDVILGTDGRERVIEANPRVGGDGITKLIAAAYGVDNVRALISLALGEPFDVHLKPTRTAHAAVEVISSPLNVDGELVRWEGVAEARAVPGITDLDLQAKPGDSVRPHSQSAHKIGLLVAAGSSAEDASASLEKASALIRPIVRPIKGAK
ncbi:ATP-grasp domain-containing protein [Streptomyces paradoxus]|uniref:Biotin carboxylase n=1 Tax=Streptomyces paradoxus TaxID=66375 RepID=A0A7W9THQ1_9ACTN|nr:ATP-grasp domain-containing protein [Streptomyces paradoxus]MBB6080948.1 biotin carboxylase [Streptomyces paradoxus]